jgi:peptidoglycan hydrolase-like protein with peptidoglycan-binding domain
VATKNLNVDRQITRLCGHPARFARRTAASGGLAAGSGGVGGTGSGGAGGGAAPTAPVATPGCPASQLGTRTLELGDCGDDVTTLNWILKSKQYGAPALVDKYEGPTRDAVRTFQREADLTPDGVFDTDSAGALITSMPKQIATWYGPGFFGNTTACGQTLTRRTLGVAHKTLPCGSKVVLRYKGRFIRTTVIDRGPFANHAKWDLAQATAEALHFEYTDRVRATAIRAR